jgi:hypothetical protein
VILSIFLFTGGMFFIDKVFTIATLPSEGSNMECGEVGRAGEAEGGEGAKKAAEAAQTSVMH